MGSIDTDNFEQRLQRFHVTATSHSLNYLPEYIANRHGYFREQGLEVYETIVDDGSALRGLTNVKVSFLRQP
jgi:hypothetical protein